MRTFKKFFFFIFLCSGFISQGQVVNNDLIYISADETLSFNEDVINNGQIENNATLHFAQNIENNGTFNNNEDASWIIEGETQQNISGSQSISVPNIALRHVFSFNAVYLSNDLTITDHLLFDNGIISNSGQLIFGDSTGWSGASDRSYIQGEVTKKGANNFIFPTGENGYYRPIEISNLSNEITELKAIYRLENPDNIHDTKLLLRPLQTLNENEYWKVSGENITSTMDVKLAWHNNTSSSNILKNTESNVLAYWNGNHWTQGMNNTSNNGYVNAQVDRVGYYTIGNTFKENIEPVDLEVYNFVTPNGDGKNDFLEIEDIELCDDTYIEIFNRWGILVYKQSDIKLDNNKFRGFSNITNQKLNDGTYFYLLECNGKQTIKKGFIQLYF